MADVVVADMVCGRDGCGRYGPWPIWYRPEIQWYHFQLHSMTPNMVSGSTFEIVAHFQILLPLLCCVNHVVIRCDRGKLVTFITEVCLQLSNEAHLTVVPVTCFNVTVA